MGIVDIVCLWSSLYAYGLHYYKRQMLKVLGCLTFMKFDEFYGEEVEHEEVLPCRRCVEETAGVATRG